MRRPRRKCKSIMCCGETQRAHQFPRGSGDYRINCRACGLEIWEDTRAVRQGGQSKDCAGEERRHLTELATWKTHILEHGRTKTAATTTSQTAVAAACRVGVTCMTKMKLTNANLSKG